MGHRMKIAFEYIQETVLAFLKKRQPIVSIDTKKKELVGEFKNGGQEWQPQGEPEKVKVHDFPDKELGKVAPYGVYDLANNEGWVSVGINHDTARFAAPPLERSARRPASAVRAESKIGLARLPLNRQPTTAKPQQTLEIR